jgi:hypothetical protein
MWQGRGLCRPKNTTEHEAGHERSKIYCGNRQEAYSSRSSRTDVQGCKGIGRVCSGWASGILGCTFGNTTVESGRVGPGRRWKMEKAMENGGKMDKTGLGEIRYNTVRAWSIQ